MAEMKLSCEAVRQVEEVCDKFDNNPGELIAILHECQSRLGYLPEPVQRVVAKKLGILTEDGKIDMDELKKCADDCDRKVKDLDELANGLKEIVDRNEQ